MAVAAPNTRIISADRWAIGELARPPRPDPDRVIRLRGRVEKMPLQRRNSPINAALTRARNARQRIQGSFAERLTIRRQERTCKAGNQRLGIKIVRCCHRRHSMRTWGRLVDLWFEGYASAVHSLAAEAFLFDCRRLR